VDPGQRVCAVPGFGLASVADTDTGEGQQDYQREKQRNAGDDDLVQQFTRVPEVVKHNPSPSFFN
jgi:hypothetical protein